MALKSDLASWFDAAPDSVKTAARASLESGGDQESQDGGQATKAEANYRMADDPEKESCGVCANFEAPDSCKVVAGKINENHVSDKFEPGGGHDGGGSGTAGGDTGGGDGSDDSGGASDSEPDPGDSSDSGDGASGEGGG